MGDREGGVAFLRTRRSVGARWPAGRLLSGRRGQQRLGRADEVRRLYGAEKFEGVPELGTNLRWLAGPGEFLSSAEPGERGRPGRAHGVECLGCPGEFLVGQRPGDSKPGGIVWLSEPLPGFVTAAE